MDNPVLSLRILNDLESKILSNQASQSDYEDIDFFIGSVAGKPNYIKNILTENGLKDYREYIRLRLENAEGRKIQLSRVHGSVIGAINFLKTYAINNNL